MIVLHQTETLTVIKEIGVCDGSTTICNNNPISQSDFTINFAQGVNPNPSTFTSQASPGTNVELEAGAYQVTEAGLDSVAPQTCSDAGFDAGRAGIGTGVFVCTDFSPQCQGTISIGSSPGICTVTNTIVESTGPPPGTGYRFEPFHTFDGTERIDIDDSPELRLTEFSVATWFRTSNNFGDNSLLVNKGGLDAETSGNNMNYGLWFRSNEEIRGGFETSGGSNKFVTSDADYNDGEWHHAVVTFADSIVTLYIDGVFEDDRFTVTTPDIGGSHPLALGANSREDEGFYTGDLDEVGVWNRVLTETEIQNLANDNIFPSDGLVYSNSFGIINPPPTETLTVIKEIGVCDGSTTVCNDNVITPDHFAIGFTQGVNPNPSTFTSQASPGTNVELEAGAYQVTEAGLDSVAPQTCSDAGFDAGLETGPSTNVFVCTNFSPQCQGTISIGSSPGTCTVTNTVVEGPPPTETLTVIKEIGDCQGNVTVCNNNSIFPSDFTINFAQGVNPNPSTFTSQASPGTNVELEAGAYQVTELNLDLITPLSCIDKGFAAGLETSITDVYVCTNFSPQCQGTISIGSSPGTCTVTNTVVEDPIIVAPPPTETLTVIKEIGVCDGSTTVCNDNVITPDHFAIGFTQGVNPNPSTFTSQASPGTNVELEAGAYQVTEAGLDSVAPQTCSDAGFDAGLETGPSTNVFVCTNFSPQCQGTISIGSSPGTCTVTNTVVEGPPPTETLTVIKEIGVCDGSTTVCNDNVITPDHFAIGFTQGVNPNPSTFTSQASPGTNVELEAGAYQVTEAGLDSVAPQTCSDAGFDAGLETGPSTNVFVCTNFSPQCQGTISIGSSPGTCTVTNTVVEGPPPTETLTVIKEIGVCDGSTTVCNDNVITPDHFAIGFTQGVNPNPSTFTSQASPGTNVELEAGAYQVTEAGLDSVAPQTCSDAGFDAGLETGPSTNVFVCTNFSPQCQGTISIGSSPGTCTVTNTVVEGPPPTETLTVIKEIGVCDGSTTVCNDNVITPDHFAIGFTQGVNPNPSTFTSQASPGTNVELEAGAYQVTEAGLDSVAPQTCSDAGFDAGLETGPSTNVFVCTNFSPQCQGTISIGSSPGTCTVTNTVVEGPPPTETLTVIKEIGVCDGSTTICNNNSIFPSDFTINFAQGVNPNPSTFTSQASPGTNVELEAGAYQVTEAGLDSVAPQTCSDAGFDAGLETGPSTNVFVCTNFSPQCQGTISIGSSPGTCTVTNTVVEGPPPTETLTVIKEIGVCDGSTTICNNNSIFPSDFTINFAQGVNPNPSTFTSQASPGTNVELEAGAYQVTEAGLDSVAPQTCSDAGFDAGRAGIGTGVFVCTDFSPQCQGTISIGSSPGICTVTNTIVESTGPPPGTGYRFEPFHTFDGTERIDIDDSPELRLTEFSVATWFRTSNNFGDNSLLVNKGGLDAETSGNNMNYGLWFRSNEEIRGGFETSGGSNKFVTSDADYNDGEWHHAVVTFADRLVTLYIDGVFEDDRFTITSPDIGGSHPLALGANSREDEGFYTGDLDEVGVWNRMLTETEIQNLANDNIFPSDGLVYSNSFSNIS